MINRDTVITEEQYENARKVEKIVDKHLSELMAALDSKTTGLAERSLGLYIAREKTASIFREYTPTSIQERVLTSEIETGNERNKNALH